MTTKEFIEKKSKDEVVTKKMESCKSPEEAYEVAKEAGLTDDFETFKAVMTAVNKRIKGELSDDELDYVAGGMSEEEFTEVALKIFFAASV
ncbi:MAG: Nif11-like leader peptide family RiPP precursor [Oscillospiraceae bacterium]